VKDLGKRKGRWLFDDAREMRKAIRKDFAEWQKAHPATVR